MYGSCEIIVSRGLLAIVLGLDILEIHEVLMNLWYWQAERNRLRGS